MRSIRAYVKEAIELSRVAKKKSPQKRNVSTVEVPPELHVALRANKKAAAAFNSLTPGRQRDYAEYIATAKRPETKLKRLEKILPMITTGVGLNDKYRS